jgi:hypothetical protein
MDRILDTINEDETDLALPAHPRPDRDDTMDTETDDEEEREYYIEVIDGVRHLQYSVVVPPDGPLEPLALAQQGNSENANEPHVQPTQHDSRWGENIVRKHSSNQVLKHPNNQVLKHSSNQVLKHSSNQVLKHSSNQAPKHPNNQTPKPPQPPKHLFL